MQSRLVLLFALLCATPFACAAEQATGGDVNKNLQTQTDQPAHERQDPFVKRPFEAQAFGRWIGNAVCYGPHRDGQSPDGASPSREQLLEDLHIMSGHWHMIRMYGSAGATETVLELIRDNDIDMKVVVGAWIATEAVIDEQGNTTETFPDTVTNNRNEVETAIRLANEYPGIVAAITVGNETQVEWSFHKVRPDVLIGYIRQARAQTDVPVSTADVSTYWRKPRSKPVADELDFIMTHIYAMWNGQTLDNAMAWTKEQYDAGLNQHPDHTFVIGEAGWATTKHSQGEQATLIVGKAGEPEQKTFYESFTAWATENNIPNFFFEAFDENWKGGPHPDEVEKHWGLYNADRTPKEALK